MNDPRRKSPTTGLAVFIVVVVLIVIGTVLFNAIRGKREYDEAHPGTVSAPAVSAAAPAAGSDSQ